MVGLEIFKMLLNVMEDNYLERNLFKSLIPLKRNILILRQQLKKKYSYHLYKLLHLNPI
jgi:hypothetical protein